MPARGRPSPIVFVHDQLAEGEDVVGLDVTPDPEELADRLRGGRNSWTLQVYLRLRRRGWSVELAPRVLPGRLCIMHASTYRRARARTLASAFLVVIRADRPPVLLADRLIVQNPRLVAPGAAFVPHFPQPGLVPRDPARGDRVERVTYVGHAHELAPAFRSEAFRRELEAHGAELVLAVDDWRDCSATDVVLAVRDAHPHLLETKPASKLVNAWLAGCPALLGPEPAYRDLRRSELDYLEVASTDDALRALERLRAEPGLFLAMVENGRRRSPEHDADVVLARWEAVLADEIVPAYARWLRGWPARRLLRAARFAALWPLQELLAERFDARINRLSPRAALYRARGRPAKLAAALALARAEGPRRVVRVLGRRAGLG